MTTWQDQPMSRRELRERERIAQATFGTDQPTIDDADIPPTPAVEPAVVPPATVAPEQTPPSVIADVPTGPATLRPRGRDRFPASSEVTPAEWSTPSTEPQRPIVPGAPAPESASPIPAVVPVVAPAASSFAPPTPAAPASVAEHASGESAGEHTMTRRELRALRESQGEVAADQPWAQTTSVPTELPVPTPVPESAPVQPDRTAEPAVPERPSEAVPPVVPVVAAAAAATEAPTPFVPPVGHWSLQSAQADGVSSSSGPIPLVTSSTLIVPGPPGDLTAPLTSTGEIIVTGTIDLPRRLASTGTVTRLDSAEIDRLIEGDPDDSSSEVAPIRASRAVYSGGVLPEAPAGKQGQGISRTTVLAIVGGVALVIVVGIVIAGYALNIF